MVSQIEAPRFQNGVKDNQVWDMEEKDWVTWYMLQIKVLETEIWVIGLFKIWVIKMVQRYHDQIID